MATRIVPGALAPHLNIDLSDLEFEIREVKDSVQYRRWQMVADKLDCARDNRDHWGG